MKMAETALHIRELSFERDNHFLFENISALVESGEVLQVQGANGSGKSTLLRILAGFIAVENDIVLWNQQCVTRHRDEYQQQLHYIGHQSGIRPHLTVRENLQLYQALHNSQHPELIRHALEKVGLITQAETLALQLSAGQRRRLALARLLLMKQRLWILDEPLTALDKEGHTLLHDLLEKHLTEGGIAVIAAHHDFLMQEKIKTVRLDSKHV
jgi:heme exporter protein A